MFMSLFTTLINWTFKLLMAWLFYNITVWFGAPEWIVIAITAVAACESFLKLDFKRSQW